MFVAFEVFNFFKRDRKESLRITKLFDKFRKVIEINYASVLRLNIDSI